MIVWSGGQVLLPNRENLHRVSAQAEQGKLEEIEHWKAQIQQAQEYHAKLTQKRSLLVLQSKERFNEYIEVKGNIRVFMRIRPLIDRDREEKA